MRKIRLMMLPEKIKIHFTYYMKTGNGTSLILLMIYGLQAPCSQCCIYKLQTIFPLTCGMNKIIMLTVMGHIECCADEVKAPRRTTMNNSCVQLAFTRIFCTSCDSGVADIRAHHDQYTSCDSGVADIRAHHDQYTSCDSGVADIRAHHDQSSCEGQ